MKKGFFIMLSAIVLLLLSGCDEVSEFPEDEKSFFELSREFRCEDINNDYSEKIYVDDIADSYAYAEDELVYLSIYEPHFLIKGIPYLKENSYKLSRYMNVFSGGGYPEGVQKRIDLTAGVRVEFETDAAEISVKVIYGEVESYPWFSLTGSCGIDVYAEEDEEFHWLSTVYPKSGENGQGCEKTISLREGESTHIIMYLPTYASVEELYIGFPKGAELGSTESDETQKPVVFYGSSITQGCSASRPGTTFPAIVSRCLDIDYVNLGFSSSCKGEREIAEMIAEMDMSALVIEFDHNAETVEALEAAYGEFYKIVRQKNENIPIILLSRVSGGISCTLEETAERDRVIQTVYEEAVLSEDENIYFIDGCTLSEFENRELLLADDRHPNDLGMKLIADAIIEVLTPVLINK